MPTSRPEHEAVGFVCPPLHAPSGGNTYDEEVLRAWSASVPLHRVTVAPGDAQGLASALRRFRVCVVDGLVGAEQPEVLEAARSSVVLLVHMPRPFEPSYRWNERRRAQALEARSLRAARRVVVPSRWAAAELRSLYGFEGSVVVAPGVREAAAADGTGLALLQLGALGPLKDQLGVVQAFRKGCGSSTLTIAGPTADADYRRDVLALAEQGDGRVEVLGAIRGEALEAVFARTSLLVSMAVRETFGLVVTEALARGIPAVVRRGTGAEEALSSGGGLPGAAVDGSELPAILRRWETDPLLRDEWRRAALEARARLRRWGATAADLAAVCGAA